MYISLQTTNRSKSDRTLCTLLCASSLQIRFYTGEKYDNNSWICKKQTFSSKCYTRPTNIKCTSSPTGLNLKQHVKTSGIKAAAELRDWSDRHVFSFWLFFTCVWLCAHFKRSLNKLAPQEGCPPASTLTTS